MANCEIPLSTVADCWSGFSSLSGGVVGVAAALSSGNESTSVCREEAEGGDPGGGEEASGQRTELSSV